MLELKNVKAMMFVAFLSFICGSTNAQRKYKFVRPVVRPVHVTVVTGSRPRPSVRLCNRYNQKERFCMALDYLKNNKILTVKQYSKMTGLTMEKARAELDAFVADKRKPILTKCIAKEQIYVLRNNL